MLVPVTYTLRSTDDGFDACGVVLPDSDAPIHTGAASSSVHYLRVSLWGLDYCEEIALSSHAKEFSKRVVLAKRTEVGEEGAPCATLVVEVKEKTITIRAVLYAVNRTPFSLEMVQNKVRVPLGSIPMNDSSFVPFAPIVVDANRTLERAPVVDQKRANRAVRPAFRTKVVSLEKQLLSLRRPDEVHPRKRDAFVCWVASPTNQKMWYSVSCTDSTTFEDLWKQVLGSMEIETPLRFTDFYFLWVTSEKVVRVTMGEYLTNFREFPRFLLRHKHHGIRGCVVTETVSANRVEFLFHDDAMGEEAACNFGVLSDEWLKWGLRVKGTETGCMMSNAVSQEKGIKVQLTSTMLNGREEVMFSLPLSVRMIKVGSENGIVIEPQYVVFNQSSFDLVLKECNSSFLYRMPAGTRSILCLQHFTPTSQFQLRRESSDWQYSGLFTIQDGVSSVLKLRNTQTHQILILRLVITSTPSFLLLSFASAPDTPPFVFQNYCPFPVLLEQSGQQQQIPPYCKYNLIETSSVASLKLLLPSAKGEAVHTLDKEATKRLSVSALVTDKEDCIAETDVYVFSRGKWHYRTARLIDHAILLYRKASLTKRVTGGHSSLSLALPLQNCVVKYEPSSISFTTTKSALLRLALQCSPLLPSSFTLYQLQNALATLLPSSKTGQALQDLLSIGILYKLPQDSTTPITLQQDPLYAFRTRPIAVDCSVTLLVVGVRLQLFFTSSEIALKWAKMIRFEIDTAVPFAPQNWLGAHPNHCELRDVDCER